MTKTLVTAKVNPDLDGVACSYAYAELLTESGENVVGGVFGKPHPEAKYLIDRFDIKDIDYNPQEEWDKFILVDASDTKGMPGVLRPEDTIEIVDHRNIYDPEKTFPNAKIQNEMVGAAATLIAEKFYNSPIVISHHAAILLYGAIFSNTLNLKAKVTVDRDHKAVDWLASQTEIPKNLIYDMFEAKTKQIINSLEEELASETKDFNVGEKTVAMTQLEVVGLEKIVDNNYKTVASFLNDYQKKNNIPFVFLTAIDLESNYNLFITEDGETQKLLTKVFNVTFQNNIAKRSGLILRKEILPLIRPMLK